MKAKVIGLSVVGVLLIALLVVLLATLPKSYRGVDFHLADDTIRVGDKFVTVMVVPRPFGFFSDLSQSDNMGVDVVLHDVSDPRRSEVIELTARGSEMNLRNEANLIGYDGRHVWVFGHTLTGVNVATKQKVGLDELNRVNPELRGGWLEQSKYYKMDDESMRLLVTVGDGRKFVLEPSSMKALPYVAPVQVQAKSHEEYMKQIAAYVKKTAMYETGPGRFFYSGERISQTEWVGLLSEEQLNELIRSWSELGKAPYGEVRRKLYRLRLESTEDRGSTYTKVVGHEALGQDSYLEAGLMRDGIETKALRLSGPEGYLVMHKWRLGDQGTMMLTRVDMQGKKIWEFDTGILKPDQILPGAKHLGLVASRSKLYSVDLSAGSMIERNLP
jgi:hypothetical protein